MELKRTVLSAIDISAAAELLTYTATGDLPIEVIARVDLGSVANPLSGVGGSYTLTFAIGGVAVEPASTVIVGSSLTRAIMVSRPIPLAVGDVVSVLGKGLSGDTSVDTVTTLRDATPIKVDAVFGSGEVLVNHYYGATGGDPTPLAYFAPGNIPIVDGRIRSYLKADYDAGRTSNAYIKSATTTDVNGFWRTPMMLDPAVYTLVYSKPGSFKPSLRTITVVAG